MSQQVTSISGKRGYWRYLYGSHGWVPEVQNDFSGGVISDVTPQDLPANALVDSVDFLLNQTGVARKRGAWSYAGPAMTAASSAKAVAYADFPAGSKLVAVGNNGHIYTITSGLTTDVGGSTVTTVDTPKFRVGGAKNLLIFTNSDGTTAPVKYDGTAAPAALGGTPPAGKFAALYKSRLALGGSSANPNRVYFSPTPDVESTWDTTNSWIDFDHAVTGLCGLQNTLLVFSNGALERLTGSTPPPNTDMDRQPVANIGCDDARAIAIMDGNCVFANSRGVYMTNGVSVICLTKEGGVEKKWRSEVSSHSGGTGDITLGVLGSYIFVKSSASSMWMCEVPRRKWWHISNFAANMWATAVGTADELYFASSATNRVVAVANVLDRSSLAIADDDGTNIAPALTTKAFGAGPGVKRFGDLRVTYYMRSSGSPTIAVTTQKGVREASGGPTPTESPLTNGGTTGTNVDVVNRARLSTGVESEALAVTLAQSGGSSYTDIYSIELAVRSLPLVAGGQ